jgi:hypothetical protein
VRVVDRPFVQGPRQDLDRAVTPEGAVFRVQDGRLRNGIAWGKRNGYGTAGILASLTSTAITGTPQAIGEIAGRDVIVSNWRAYMRPRRDSSGGWQESGRASAFKPRRIHWVHYDDAAGSVYQFNVEACSDGVRYFVTVAYAFVDASNVHNVDFIVLDALTGIQVLHHRFSGHTQPRLVRFGNDITLIVVDDDDGKIYGYRYLVALGLLSTATHLETLPAAAGYGIDACAMGNELLLVSSTTNTNLRVSSFPSTGAFALNGAQNVTVTAGLLSAKIFALAGVGAWVSYFNAGDGGSSTFTLSTSLVVTGGPTSYGAVSEAVFCQRTANTVWMLWRETALSPLRYALGVGALNASNGQLLSPALKVHHMQLASRPADGSAEGFRAWMHTDNNVSDADDSLNTAWGVQRKYSLETCTVHSGDRVVLRPELIPDERAHIDLGSIDFGSPPLESGQGWLPEVTSIVIDGKTRYYQACMVPLRTRLNGVTEEAVFSVDSSALVLYEYDELDTVQLAYAGNAPVLVGGHLQELPSDRITAYLPTSIGFENGFVRDLAILKVTQAGSGALAPGLYQACAVAEYIDSDGRRHRSAPSNVASWTVTGSSNNSATLTIAAYSAFEREVSSAAKQTAVHVYCTGPDGAVFYRITDNNFAPRAYSGNYNVDFLVFGPPDSASEILYTVGNVLPNQPAPAHRFGCVAGNRLVLGGLFDPRVGEISKYFRPNQPAEFTRAPEFRFVLPEAMTGVSYLDGQIVAFSETGIYLVNATSPPNDQGFPAMPTPDRLPTDVGCLPDSPIVELPAGLVFQSHRGLYLLPRGFGLPKYLSGPVKEDLLGCRVLTYAHVCHDATPYPVFAGDRDEGQHLVYFGVGTTDVQKVLVLDADTLQWVSMDVLHTSGVNHVKVMGSWAGRAVIARTTVTGGNGVAVEADGHLDSWATALAPSPRFRIETGEIRPFGMMGRGTVLNARLLTEYREECSVTVRVTHNGKYSQTYTQARLELGATDTKGDRVALDFKPRGGSTDLNSIAYEIEVGFPAAEGGGDELVESEGVLIHGLGLMVESVQGMGGLAGNKRS